MSDIPSFPYRCSGASGASARSRTSRGKDGEEFLEIAQAAGVRTTTRTYPMAQANDALTDLRDGRVQGSAVLVPDHAPAGSSAAVAGPPSGAAAVTARAASRAANERRATEARRGMPRAGLEPAASRSSVLHSPKLSYRGAGRPTRSRYKGAGWPSDRDRSRPAAGVAGRPEPREPPRPRPTRSDARAYVRSAGRRPDRPRVYLGPRGLRTGHVKKTLVVAEKFNTALRIAVVLSDGRMKRARIGGTNVFRFERPDGRVRRRRAARPHRRARLPEGARRVDARRASRSCSRRRR